MSCTSSMVETRLPEAAMPHINDLCSKHWKNIEHEDRVAEASLFFIEALRRLPLNTGHFIQDFDNVLFEPFISTLDKSEQAVIRMLINGVSRAKTARVHGMTQHQLKKLLDQIGEKYMQWDS